MHGMGGINKARLYAEAIARERSRTHDEQYINKIEQSYYAVSSLLEGLKPLVIHQYLDYLEKEKTFIGGLAEIIKSLIQEREAKNA